MNEVKQLASATGRSLNAIYKLKRKLGRLPTEQEVRDQRRGRPKKKMSLSEIRHNALLLWCELSKITNEMLLSGECNDLLYRVQKARRLIGDAEEILKEIEDDADTFRK